MQPTSRVFTLHSSITGLNFQATVGTMSTSNEKGRTRVFIGSDAKGISIVNVPNVKKDVWVRMRAGGDLDLSEVDEFRTGLSSLCAEMLKSYSALIQVGSGGDILHSDLAGRVKIKLADGSVKTRTVPASQVEGRGRKLFIPRWLAIEKTGQQAFLGEVCLPELVEAGISALEYELSRHLAVLCEAAKPFQDVERKEAPLREARRQKELEEKELLRVQAIAKQKKLAQQIASQEAASAERVANLPLLAANVTVHGKDWTKKHGRFVSTEWSVDSADVRVSGKRAYIFRAGKELFWKPLDKIKIDHGESS